MADEYAHDVGRKLCLQLCSLAGYGAASDGTLDVLSDLVKMFLRQCSVGARSYAENAGRTETNAKDIVPSTLHTEQRPQPTAFSAGHEFRRFGIRHRSLARICSSIGASVHPRCTHYPFTAVLYRRQRSHSAQRCRDSLSCQRQKTTSHSKMPNRSHFWTNDHLLDPLVRTEASGACP